MNRLPDHIAMITDPRSDVAEAYRTLRTNIQFTNSANKVRTIAVTSSAPLEGKTTTAANLAACMAQAGLRVVLIDADLRRPALHKVFGLPNDAGLVTLLAGQTDRLEGLLLPTPVPGLMLLPSGPIPLNPAELLAKGVFADVLGYLCSETDYIVVDTPPVAVVTDAAIVSSVVDGVILVVSKATRQAVLQAVSNLRNVHAHILGLVLNQYESGHDRYYHY